MVDALAPLYFEPTFDPERAMPPGNAGGLGEQAYLNIVAFILDFNGARPGNQPLTAATMVPIRSVASGKPRAKTSEPPPSKAVAGEPLGGRACGNTNRSAASHSRRG